MNMGSIPKALIQQDRKFKVIVYGVKECAKAHQSTFAQCKTNSVSGVLKSVDNQLSEHTIRDCQRLGNIQMTSVDQYLSSLLDHVTLLPFYPNVQNLLICLAYPLNQICQKMIGK